MGKFLRDDIDKFFDYNINIPAKTLYLGKEDGVEHSMAETAVKGLNILDAKNRKKKLTILMNNPGGDEYHGLAIYDAIKACKSPTIIKVFGHCMSMGAWILQAGDKRIMSPNSTLMIHYGTTAYEGHSKDFDRWSEENKRICALMEDHLLERIHEKHLRYSKEKLQKEMMFDLILNAQQAVELGLADKIL